MVYHSSLRMASFHTCFQPLKDPCLHHGYYSRFTSSWIGLQTAWGQGVGFLTVPVIICILSKCTCFALFLWGLSSSSEYIVVKLFYNSSWLVLWLFLISRKSTINAHLKMVAFHDFHITVQSTHCDAGFEVLHGRYITFQSALIGLCELSCPAPIKTFFVLFSSAISDSASHLAVTQNTAIWNSQDLGLLSISPLDGFGG